MLRSLDSSAVNNGFLRQACVAYSSSLSETHLAILASMPASHKPWFESFALHGWHAISCPSIRPWSFLPLAGEVPAWSLTIWGKLMEAVDALSSYPISSQRHTAKPLSHYVKRLAISVRPGPNAVVRPDDGKEQADPEESTSVEQGSKEEEIIWAKAGNKGEHRERFLLRSVPIPYLVIGRWAILTSQSGVFFRSFRNLTSLVSFYFLGGPCSKFAELGRKDYLYKSRSTHPSKIQYILNQVSSLTPICLAPPLALLHYTQSHMVRLSEKVSVCPGMAMKRWNETIFLEGDISLI